MSTETVTLALPEVLYQRLKGAALATKQPLEKVLLHALSLGSPPSWEDVPPEFQLDIAGLDKLDDEALWAIARGRREPPEFARYDELLEKNAAGPLTPAEHDELEHLREDADRFMLRKAHAAALLRWRGHRVVSRGRWAEAGWHPPAERSSR
jgi:hypothetical protein